MVNTFDLISENFIENENPSEIVIFEQQSFSNDLLLFEAPFDSSSDNNKQTDNKDSKKEESLLFKYLVFNKLYYLHRKLLNYGINDEELSNFISLSSYLSDEMFEKSANLLLDRLTKKYSNIDSKNKNKNEKNKGDNKEKGNKFNFNKKSNLKGENDE